MRKLDELAVERLVVVLGVVLLGQRLVDGAQLGGDEREALALEAADDLADQAALDGVGLAHDEGPVHGGDGRYVPRPTPAERLRPTGSSSGPASGTRAAPTV